ncbi:D-glycero-alpha-D-manno-heptose-1,7-bisphosphate 7-phosphatase [Acidobacteriota bacterium]
MKKKAVFIDRDGTINRDVGYPSSYSMIDIYPYSFDAVKKVKEAGFLAVIITNQSGIGRGIIKEENLHDIHAKLNEEFERHGVSFDGIYYCPHYVYSKTEKFGKKCPCRKPNPGMGKQAAEDLNIDTSLSYMIGDKVEDLLFGININAVPILVLTGYGQDSIKKLKELGIQPGFVAKNLMEAVEWITKQEKAASAS